MRLLGRLRQIALAEIIPGVAVGQVPGRLSCQSFANSPIARRADRILVLHFPSGIIAWVGPRAATWDAGAHAPTA